MSESSPAVRSYPSGSRGSRLSHFLSSDRMYWNILLWPAVIIIVAVFIYPLLYSLYLSLTSYDLLAPPRFVGLRNYVRILSDAHVWNSVRVTLTFTLWSLLFELLIGFGIALILHDVGFTRDFFRTVFTIPIMLTPVVIGSVWRMMANYDYGIFNYFSTVLGYGKIGWTITTQWAMPLLVISDIWQTTGFVVLTLSAGLAQLPEEIYEAAQIDGASYWQRLWRLTVPLLRPVFLVVIIFRSYSLLQMVDKVMTLTQGGPSRATETLSYHVYSRMFEGYQVGYSSAVAIVLMAFTLLACGYFIWKV